MVKKKTLSESFIRSSSLPSAVSGCFGTFGRVLLATTSIVICGALGIVPSTRFNDHPRRKVSAESFRPFKANDRFCWPLFNKIVSLYNYNNFKVGKSTALEKTSSETVPRRHILFVISILFVRLGKALLGLN